MSEAGAKPGLAKTAEPSGKIKAVLVENLTVFDALTVEFCPGINVFVGQNGTGKTHLLKVLYGLARTHHDLWRQQRFDVSRDEFLLALHAQCEELFVANRNLATLRREPDHPLNLGLTMLDERFNTTSGVDVLVEPISPLFIPSREFLSSFPGFMALYSRREISFDRTYRDLCEALELQPLRPESPEFVDTTELLADLESELGGELILDRGRFAVRATGVGREIEAHLLAEGQRKLATLVRLIQNGELNRKTILFWDEPEANLNPVLADKIIEALLRLAHQGVQIFLATHDYLVAHRLSLASDFDTHPGVSFRFFSFRREQQLDPVRVESGDTMADLSHDPILEEHLRFASREEQLALARARGDTR